MRVRVNLRRDRGAYLALHGAGTAATGDLHLTHLTADGRRIPALQLLSADRHWPRLFEPRLVDLSANHLRFIGFERVDRAWVMQEWDCELIGF